MCFPNIAAAALLTSLIAKAHRGHGIKQVIEERGEQFQQVSKRDLTHCSAKLKARGFEQRTIEMRSEILRSAREKWGLPTGWDSDLSESFRR